MRTSDWSSDVCSSDLFKEGEIHMAYLPIAWVGDFIFSVAAAIALRFVVNLPESPETAQHDLRQIAPTLYFCSPRTWSSRSEEHRVGNEGVSTGRSRGSPYQ